MKKPHLVGLYTLFVAVSIATNIGGQWLSTQLYRGKYYIPLSILAGTAIGLVVKYVLDKHWIFRFQSKNHTHELRTFILYTAMGGATTIIFWTTEASFQLVFRTELMRYLGAMIGLIIGYLTKYSLDKHFVFRKVS